MGVNTVGREYLAREIQAVLNLTSTGRDSFRTSAPYKLVNIIIKTIEKALERGESVTIQGFGTFRVKKRKAITRRQAVFVQATQKDPLIAVCTTPARNRVVFKAAKSLKRFVSEPIVEEENA